MMPLCPSLEDLNIDRVIQAHRLSCQPNSFDRSFCSGYSEWKSLSQTVSGVLSQYVELSLNGGMSARVLIVSGAPAQGLVARLSSVNCVAVSVGS